MNNLIQEMAAVLSINTIAMMHLVMDIQDEQGTATPEMVKQRMISIAFAHGVNSWEHKKVCQLNDEFNKAAA